MMQLGAPYVVPACAGVGWARREGWHGVEGAGRHAQCLSSSDHTERGAAWARDAVRHLGNTSLRRGVLRAMEEAESKAETD